MIRNIATHNLSDLCESINLYSKLHTSSIKGNCCRALEVLDFAKRTTFEFKLTATLTDIYCSLVR